MYLSPTIAPNVGIMKIGNMSAWQGFSNWLPLRGPVSRCSGVHEMITSLRMGLALLGLFAVASTTPAAAQTPSPAGAKVYFINLKDGAEVTSPFLVQFGLSGMGIAPGGVETPNTGHHTLLLDTRLTADQMKEAIPADDTHRHFGGGQTEAMVTLPKGTHTLQLVLADWSH